MSGVVELNVGGMTFSTTESTLCNTGYSFFTTLLSEDFKESSKDAQGRFFIDRDGSSFQPILNWLRTGVLEVSPTIPMRAVLGEAHFYCLEPLVTEIETLLAKKENLSQNLSAIRTNGYYDGSTSACEAVVRFVPSPDNPQEGTLLWTQGRDAVKNMRVMAVVGLLPHSPTPSIWKDDPETAQEVARFMVGNVRRGTWVIHNEALVIKRGVFSGEPGGRFEEVEGNAESRIRNNVRTYYGVGLSEELMLSNVAGQQEPQFNHFRFIEDGTFESAAIERALQSIK